MKSISMVSQLPKTLPAFFWHFIKKQPVAFAVFFIAPIAIVLEVNVLPYALKLIIDGIVNHQGDKEAMIKIIAPALWLASVAWITFLVIIRIQNFWQGFVIPKFQADIRMSVFEYITFHSQRYFSNQLSGSLANKISDLPKALEAIRMMICWNGIQTFAVVIVSIVMLAFISAIYAWILSVWIIVHIIISIYFAKKIYLISEENAEDRSALSGSMVDTISNHVPMRLFARRTYEHGYVGTKQAIEQLSNKRLILIMNKMRLYMDVLVFIMYGSMVYLSIKGWQHNNISAGDIVFILNLSWSVVFNMWFLSHALADFFKEIGVAQQALNIINVPHDIVDIPDAKPLVVKDGNIIFDNVTFKYQRNNNLFENKHVEIESGTKVGLVGFSGSGKTTFVNLILRVFDVESGRILIDGQDIAKVTQDSLHENISMIPQDTSLFHRSIIENIRYGRLDATDLEVMEASKGAHCHEFISVLPAGYDSLVGERGINLSGGQRQRIAIARAMLKNAPILILDEATSALDSVTEKQIQESLHFLMQGRTTIVIAHRLSTLSEMDRILVFDKGHIIEDGTHNELLNRKGHYAKMWHMQAGGFLPEKDG